MTMNTDTTKSDLVPCPLCGESKGYTLSEGSTYRWWYVSCAACGDELGECHANRAQRNDPLPARWPAADEHWNRVGAHAQKLRAQLEAAQADAKRMCETLNFVATHFSTDWPERCQSNVLAARGTLTAMQAEGAAR